MHIKLRVDPTVTMKPGDEPNTYILEPRFFHPDARVMLAQADVIVAEEGGKTKVIDSALLIVSGSTGKLTKTGAESNVKPRIESGGAKKKAKTTGASGS